MLVERPRLLALLDRGSDLPLTLVSSAPGSGKTALVRSWLAASADRQRVPAWVAVEREETDAARFWASVTDALRDAGALAADDPVAPAPGGDQVALVERIVNGVRQPALLIVDDVHELATDEALEALELLLHRGPPRLHLVLLTRRDPPIGIHRLRLAGELVEIRSEDLAFRRDEAAELLAAAGIAVRDGDLDRLHRRTEGWAAGLRLAALSLDRHDDPARFVAEFSGSERTVADYLLGEVLATQPPEIRRLLLRTCILDRVCGPLADLLTGGEDGALLLSELEAANALVVATDVSRTWFRLHHLLADLLRLELRRVASSEQIAELHRLAAGWLAADGQPVEAIRHAQLGGDRDTAAELLGRNWADLVLDGREGALAGLLEGADLADPELAAIAAADRMARSRWAEADALIDAAERGMGALPDVDAAERGSDAARGTGALPEPRRARAQAALATVRLLRARRVGGLDEALDGAGPLLDGSAGSGALQAYGLLNLGIAESWAFRLAESRAHLDRALALARELDRPHVELACLTTLGTVENLLGGLDRADDRSREAIAIAEQRGWTSDPLASIAALTLGVVALDRGRLADAEDWLARAAPALHGAPEPAATVGLRHAEGMLAYARGRFAQAATAFEDAERLADELRAPHFLARRAAMWARRARIAEGAEPRGGAEGATADAGGAAVSGAEGATHSDADLCAIAAREALAVGDPEAAAAAIAPVLDGRAIPFHPNVEVEALLLDAVARRALGDRDAAERGVERALALTEPQGRTWSVLTVPGVADVLRDHPRHRTKHGAHLRALLDAAHGAEPATAPAEQLSEREVAVLRLLPTNLSANDIAKELFLSVHTVKTHMRRLYAKLDVHTRAEAVEKGRTLGLLARR